MVAFCWLFLNNLRHIHLYSASPRYKLPDRIFYYSLGFEGSFTCRSTKEFSFFYVSVLHVCVLRPTRQVKISRPDFMLLPIWRKLLQGLRIYNLSGQIT